MNKSKPTEQEQQEVIQDPKFLEIIKQFPTGTPFLKQDDSIDQPRYGWVTGYDHNVHGELIFTVRFSDGEYDTFLHPSHIKDITYQWEN